MLSPSVRDTSAKGNQDTCSEFFFPPLGVWFIVMERKLFLNVYWKCHMSVDFGVQYICFCVHANL